MPHPVNRREPECGSTNFCPIERKCETSRRSHDRTRRRRSCTPEKKCKKEEKHKADCGCKNCQATKECRQPKDSHLIEKYTFNTSTSGILVPQNANYMEIFMIGGGGGGGKYKFIPAENLHGGGGGGAGGTYVKKCFPVKAGKHFDVEIGLGGVGGNDTNGDGQPGAETSLIYDSCVTKKAFGGKGGMYNLNGGFGGKGGCRSGDGADGQKGKDGTIDGKGGAGGNADNKNQVYGDGGIGGSSDALVLAQTNCSEQKCAPPDSPRPRCSRRRRSCSRSSSRSRSRSCSKERKSKYDAPILLVGPNGANGANGFCSVTFYRDGPACEKPYCVDPVQHIKAVVPSTTYWLNPDVDLVVVDTSNSEAHLSLGKPRSANHRLIVKLLHTQGLTAYITTVTGGTFAISANNPIVTLFFDGCKWTIEDNARDVYSFYPTTQQGPTLLLDCFKPGVEGSGSGPEAVAISADGNTVAIGAPDDSSNGATWIYVRKCGAWEKQAKLYGALTSGASNQGAAVSLSADGNTLAVGGPSDNGNTGAVWIFVRSECGKWSQQGAKLVVTGVVDFPVLIRTGDAVDLSADGNTLVVGSRNSVNTNLVATTGLITVFTRTAGTWSQGPSAFSSTLLVSNGQVTKRLGTRVSISADGTVIAAGGVDSVVIFSLLSGVLTEVQVLESPNSGNNFGVTGLDLSADGLNLAVGATIQNTVGAVYIYANVAGVWTLQGLPIEVTDLLSPDPRFGYSVSFSGDASTLAVGAFRDNTTEGAVYVFTRTGTNWVKREKLIGPPYQGDVYQGASVALSSEGSTLAVGSDVQVSNAMFWIWV
jgi:hypothetical protein